MRQNIESLKKFSPGLMEYWGGFFDHALYFSIDTKRADPPGNTIFSPHISVCSTRIEVLRALQPVLPGNIVPFHSNFEGKGHPQWVLRIRKQLPAYHFLEWITPYLDYKNAQAEISKAFLGQKREVRRELEGLIRVPRYSTSEDRMAVEQDFKQQLEKAKALTFDEPHLPAQPARLAGIIDAGAVFSLNSTQRANTTNLDYQAYCLLTTVQRGLVEGLYQTYEGTKPAKESERVNRYAGPSYLWHIDGIKMLPLLRRVEPYLIFQRPEVHLLEEFLTSKPLLTRTSPDLLINAQRTRTLQSFVDLWHELKQQRTS